MLLDANADVDAVSQLGRTPLLAASASGTTEVVRLWLAKGAEVDAADASGVTLDQPRRRGGPVAGRAVVTEIRRWSRESMTFRRPATDGVRPADCRSC
jgi:hypothetical protein